MVPGGTRYEHSPGIATDATIFALARMIWYTDPSPPHPAFTEEIPPQLRGSL